MENICCRTQLDGRTIRIRSDCSWVASCRSCQPHRTAKRLTAADNVLSFYRFDHANFLMWQSMPMPLMQTWLKRSAFRRWTFQGQVWQFDTFPQISFKHVHTGSRNLGLEVAKRHSLSLSCLHWVELIHTLPALPVCHRSIPWRVGILWKDKPQWFILQHHFYT